MRTTTVTVEEVLKDETKCPINLSVIPNYMGINLCSVESITYTRQRDGQLVNLTFNFVPA